MTVVLDQPVLEELRSELRGPVIGLADPDYEIARKIHNGMIDKRPAVIAQCAGVADVSGVEFGLGHDLPIAVRGGGQTSRAKRSAMTGSSSTCPG